MILEGIERVLIGRVERLLYGTMRYTFIDDDITVHRPRISEVVEDMECSWCMVYRRVLRGLLIKCDDVWIGCVDGVHWKDMCNTFIDDDIAVDRTRIREVVEDIAGLHRCWAWSHVSRKVPRRVVAMFHGKFREWWSPFFVEGYEKGG